MPTYISLIKWTQQGIKDVKKSPQRLDDAKQAFSAAGGELREFYLALGEYDMVIVAEFPNDEAYTASLLATASRGAVRTATLKAFTEDEYRRIIASLP
jgi:uncharacterized protein with GYD domain